MASVQEVRALCLRSMEPLGLGLEQDQFMRGPEFYQFLFDRFPYFRPYFFHDGYNPETSVDAERFIKQWQNYLLSMKLIVFISDDDWVFETYLKHLVDTHLERIGTPERLLWRPAMEAFTEFIKNNYGMDEATDGAWSALINRYELLVLHYIQNLELTAATTAAPEPSSPNTRARHYQMSDF